MMQLPWQTLPFSRKGLLENHFISTMKAALISSLSIKATHRHSLDHMKKLQSDSTLFKQIGLKTIGPYE